MISKVYSVRSCFDKEMTWQINDDLELSRTILEIGEAILNLRWKNTKNAYCRIKLYILLLAAKLIQIERLFTNSQYYAPHFFQLCPRKDWNVFHVWLNWVAS